MAQFETESGTKRNVLFKRRAAHFLWHSLNRNHWHYKTGKGGTKRTRIATQGELAKKVGIHPNILGRYERGETTPNIDMAAKLADALGVSLDYLFGKTDIEMDMTLRDKILTIQRLPSEERQHVIFAIDAMIRDAKARQAYGS